MLLFPLFKRAPGRVLAAVVATIGLLAATGTAASAGASVAAVVAPAAAGTTAFHPVAPGRLLDTRQAKPLQAGATVTIGAAGSAGMPAGIAAVVVNVTATNTSGAGYLSAYPSGGARPTTSVLNAER